MSRGMRLDALSEKVGSQAMAVNLIREVCNLDILKIRGINAAQKPWWMYNVQVSQSQLTQQAL